MKIIERMRLRRAVKEAIDNLPQGICFFNREGLPVLCNHRMHKLVSSMTNNDLQVITDLERALGISADGQKECRRTMPDGSIWKFSMQHMTDSYGKRYTCAAAFDVTELCIEQMNLQRATEAQQHTMQTLEHLQKNVVASTHEEEVLALKMRLHNELGYDLQMIRRLMEKGCSPAEKAQFLKAQRDVLQKLRIREERKAEPLEELMTLADALDMHIALNGTLPQEPYLRVLLSLILRECLINAARHAHGHSIAVLLRGENGILHTEITNNGEPPDGTVTESGGLSLLRRRIEGAGGTMSIESKPVFRLIADLPQTGKETHP